MNDIVELFKVILEQISDNSEPEVKVSECDNCTCISFCNCDCKDIKGIIAEYKENLDLLDDCIFVEVLDELSTYNVDIKQFDELLNRETLTESEETYVLYLINFTNSLIRQHIENKIRYLSELTDKF